MRRVTPFPELDGVLDDLVQSIERVIGAELIGVYLQGSFATGGFDHHSDVDFAVVVVDHPSDGQVEGLQTEHGRIYDSGPEWAKHLEGSYFPLEVVRDPARSDVPLWYLDHGSRELERSTHCNTPVVRWVLRERGVTLTGPPPDTLLDPIPAAELQQYIAGDIQMWGAEILGEPDRFHNRFYQAFIVLNMARMLHDVRIGAVDSKRVGAAWAIQNLDPQWGDLIERAWDGRPDPARSVRQRADPGDFARTLDFVRYIMAEASATPPPV